jgi:hypothetical protein
MLCRLASLLLLAPGFGSACDCIKASARDAKRGAEAVFRGTVVAFRDSGNPHLTFRMVVFRVNRVWKGPVRDEIETVAWVGDSCEAYAPGVLQTGSELLEYAHRVPPDPEFFPIGCSTQLVRNATQDIQEPGRGRKPKPK